MFRLDQCGSLTSLISPFSMYIWQPPQSPSDTGTWIEPLLADTQEYALYVANLIHKDSQAVIKVIHDEKTLASFPDEQTIKQVEQQSARQ